MATSTEFKGLCLMEKDKNGDVLWTWSFPTIDSTLRELIMRKSTLSTVGDADSEVEPPQFVFGHYDTSWYYLYNSSFESHPQVVAFCVVILSSDFNPEKYEDYAGHLASVYVESGGSPPDMLAHYVSAFTKGWCPEGDGRFSLTDSTYDKRRGYIRSPLKDVVKMFGIESILIYVALLLKKRIAVYSPQLKVLLKITRALPLFVWHRQNWNILYPHVEMSDVETEPLMRKTGYIIGSTDPNIESHMDEFYDLFINVPGASVTPTPAAKDAFAMGKVHKDIAMFMMSSVEDSEKTDQSFIKELSVKTRELINNLKTLAAKSVGPDAEPKLTLEILQERKLTPTMENFLYGLASAEGLVEL